MQSSVKIEISLFGAFRKYSNAPLLLDVPNGATLQELKNRIRASLESHFPQFDQPSLIDDSALADEREVLRQGYICTRNASLALLPPVCGG